MRGNNLYNRYSYGTIEGGEGHQCGSESSRANAQNEARALSNRQRALGGFGEVFVVDNMSKPHTIAEWRYTPATGWREHKPEVKLKRRKIILQNGNTPHVRIVKITAARITYDGGALYHEAGDGEESLAHYLAPDGSPNEGGELRVVEVSPVVEKRLAELEREIARLEEGRREALQAAWDKGITLTAAGLLEGEDIL